MFYQIGISYEVEINETGTYMKAFDLAGIVKNGNKNVSDRF